MWALAEASGTQAIDRAAELLVRVVDSARPLGLAELSSHAGLPKSTTSRLVGGCGAGARPRRPRRRRAVDLGSDDQAHAAANPGARSGARRAGAARLGNARHLRPARSGMTHEEILKGLYDHTLVGNGPEVA